MISRTNEKKPTIDFSGYYKSGSTTLDASNQNVQDSDIPALIQFLQDHPNIDKLNLGCNNLTDKSCAQLAQVHTIADLNLFKNKIGDEGVKLLLQNNKISELDLRSNQISAAGIFDCYWQKFQPSRRQTHYAGNPGYIIADIDKAGNYLPFPMEMERQSWLICIANSLGYPANPKGICQGFRDMAFQAIAVGDETLMQFDQRLRLLMSIFVIAKTSAINELSLIDSKYKSLMPTAAHLSYLTKSIQKKIKAAVHLIDSEMRTGIFALFDGIQVLQETYKYKYLLPKISTDRRDVPALSLVETLTLENLGGVKSITSFSGVYTLSSDNERNELTIYFQSLRAAIHEYYTANPLRVLPNMVLKLSNINHAITIGYNPNSNQWICADATIRFFSSEDGISSWLRWFTFPCENQVILSTKIDAPSAFAYQTQAICKIWQNSTEFKKIHSFTSKKIQATDKAGGTWALVASTENDLKSIAALLQNGVDLKKTGPYGETLLCRAVSKGLFDMVNILLEHRVDSNQALTLTSELVNEKYSLSMPRLPKFVWSTIAQRVATPFDIALYSGQKKIAATLYAHQNMKRHFLPSFIVGAIVFLYYLFKFSFQPTMLVNPLLFCLVTTIISYLVDLIWLYALKDDEIDSIFIMPKALSFLKSPAQTKFTLPEGKTIELPSTSKEPTDETSRRGSPKT